MFSSGMPILYFVALVTFFLSYWVDKFMLLKYYRMPPSYTINLSYYSIQIMKFSIIFHYLFGFFMFSYGAILPAKIIDAYLVGLIPFYNQYINPYRFSYVHAYIFLWSCVLLVLFYLVKFTCINLCFCCFRCCINLTGNVRYQHLQYSDDFYEEINFVQLFKEFKKTRKEKKHLLEKLKQ
jgi:hypothetical protein